MIGRSRLAAMQMLAAAVAVAAGARPTVGINPTPSPPPVDPFWPGEVERVITARRAIAGKPWKRGGRHTIKQRRALAFAAERRS